MVALRVEGNLAPPDMDMLLQHLESYAPDLLSGREGDSDGIVHEAEQLLNFPLRHQLERARELTDLLLARLDALTAGEQLQVVDDHLQTLALLQATALRANLDQRHVWAVVDVEGSVIDAAAGGSSVV